MYFKKNKNDLTDIISYPMSSGTMPKIHKDSNCDLAFKLMNENSLDKLLVEDNNKNIIGVIDESSLFEAVMANSFKGNIKNFINTKVKKVKHLLGIKKLLYFLKKKLCICI